jgi:hypothetical protein
VKRYVISPDTACAVVEDGAVLLHMRTKRYYSLNETGARLAERYDVEPPAANEAVERLIDDLAAESLISLETS